MRAEHTDQLDVDLVRAALELSLARDRLAASVSALQMGLKRSIDWREWVKARPALALAGAFALGAFLGRRP